MNRYLVLLPITIVALAISALVARAVLFSDSIANEYRESARRAIADGDLAAAKFYYSRLVGSGDRGTIKDQFNWAVILNAAGDRQASQQQLDELAPDDRAGYGPAHIAKAQLLLGMLGQPRVDTAGLLARARHHLAHGAWDRSADSDLVWARFHLAAKEPDEAFTRLTKAATARPELWYEVSRLARELNRDIDAERALDNALKDARKKLELDPKDVPSRLRLVSILNERDQIEAVRRLLNDGLDRQPNEPDLRRAASDFALKRSTEVAEDAPNSDQRRLRLLSEAANRDPSNGRVYAALQAFYSRARTDAQRLAYRETLEQLIAEGNDVAAAHFAMGNLKFMEGDASSAVFHFEMAIDLNPEAVAFANNLAWVLSHSDQPDLDRASQLAEVAYGRAPKSRSVRDTLAAIRIKQERYREALPLLESILVSARGEKKRDLHQKLATVYENLGQPEIAKRHQRMAAQPEGPDLDG